MTYCEDCGCKVYSGYCTNCHEEVFIEEQYMELDGWAHESISDKAKQFREEKKERERRNLSW